MDRIYKLENLAIKALGKYERTEVLSNLELSIQRFQQVLYLTPDNDPDRASRLDNLAIVYGYRHQRLGTPSDLEAAIRCGQQSLDLTSDGHPDRVDRLFGLSASHKDMYKQLGTLSDLETAIQYDQQALHLTPDDRPDRAGRLDNLAVSYNYRYKKLETLSDLEAAVQYGQQAVDLTPDGHPRRANRLFNLAISYGDRYEQLGTLSDLEASFQYFQQTLHLTPQNHPDRADRLHSLAKRYNDRHERTGALDDLELSIQLCQEAVDLIPESHSSRADLLGGLAIGYGHRYRQTKALDDLELSIQLLQEAINLTPEHDLKRINLLENITVGYTDRYGRTGVLDDLELSIQLSQEILDLTPKDSLDRAQRLHGLAVGYGHRYERTKALDDLDLSIQLYQEAVDLTPESHSRRAHRLKGLGTGYGHRYLRTEAPDDLELSIRHFQEALHHGSSSIVERQRAGESLFGIYAITENWPSAYDAVSFMVSLIPLLTSRYLERSDIQRQVNEIIGLASKGTAIALRAGKSVYEATRLLEASRGIITSSLGDMRTDITDLNAKFPDFAEKFSSLRDLLDNPKESRQDAQRYSTGKQFEDLIQKIRSLPDFDRFLLAPREDEMRRAAAHGPIIIVNVSEYGCHALIIEQKGLRALELPLDVEDVQIRADKLASPDIEMLEWLWDKVADPVLTSLNFVETPRHIWPRVWWILTGPLARFPIHAAGYCSEGGDKTVLDRVISSYSSSVRAIIDAHRNTSVPVNLSKEESLVLVGMGETPGYSPLQFAQKEIDMLAKIGTSMQLQVKQPLSLQKETLSALSGCKIFHFAGHGYTDSLDPSKSALVLSDNKLTVDSIFNINLNLRQDKPFLAYLSACGTGQIKHEGLIDEGLHLISAFQLAGFRHVIGTLWQVNDESCIGVAKMTYEWIQKQALSDKGLSDNSVSEGLHHACRALRSQWIQENDVREASRRGTQSKRSTDVGSSQEQSRSVSEGLHYANRKRRSRRIQKKEIRAANRGSTPFKRGTDATPTQRQPRSAEARDPRDIESVEELPLHWVPYVHFGL